MVNLIPSGIHSETLLVNLAYTSNGYQDFTKIHKVWVQHHNATT